MALVGTFLAAMLLAAPAAQATFHLMKVREVYPGGSNNASYVELQMYAAGQNLVLNHHLVAYNPDGSVNDDFHFTSDVANGANQATILIADSSYSVVFDERPLPDATDENLNLSPAGGAVCWVEGSPPDCVAWGDFTGPLPSHLPEFKVGNPASPGGVGIGKALLRTIAPSCPTLLEATDDSDDSATDFSEQTPNPRDNSSPIVETACAPPPDTTPPIATITSHPSDPSPGNSAAFTYNSNEAGSTFQCSLEPSGQAAVFTSCPSSGKSYPDAEHPAPLADGKWVFEVRAKDLAGNQGLPAVFEWTVESTVPDTTPPETTIVSKPPDPSESPSASFTYASNEPGSGFECELDGGPFASCPAIGVMYTGLADGPHSFQVRAIDPSGNVDPTPAGYSFAVALPSAPPPPTTEATPPPSATPPPVRRHHRRRCRRHGHHRRCHRRHRR